jgi:hypothetical protein
MTKIRRKTTAEPQYAAASDASTSERGRSSSAQAEPERQMAELGIGFDGLHYGYNGYRYDRLADAVAYASLMRSRPKRKDTGGPFKQTRMLAVPTDAERAVMALLGIDFHNGTYRFEGFCYDGLSDAVAYAKLILQRKT